MGNAAGSIVRQVEALFGGGSVAGLTDRQLLERFTDNRDAAGEAAFAALVTRYGPMIFHVCRQFLGDRHHAEDAFQAVFLVLARKINSIRDPDLLGPWLYGVAIRTARKAKVRLDRRRRNEDGDALGHPGRGSSVPVEPTVPPAEVSALAREQAEALHEEIDRLPHAFRLAVVVCYFEGLTLDEAAQRLRWPAGTVRSRLARARDKLRRALTRRGVGLPSAAVAATLSPRSASASVSSSLCDATTKVAIHFAAGQADRGVVSASTTALAQEVLRSMLLHKLKLSALTLLVLCAVATGAGYLTHALARKDEPGKTPASPQTQTASRPEDAISRPAPGRMFVVGRVLDPQGKPVVNSTVMVTARLKLAGRGDQYERLRPVPIGHAGSDGSGRFRLEAPRTSSSQYDTFCAVALAPGYGVGWAEVDPDDDQPAADIRLRPEQAIDGRLFDLQGRPARDVAVSVSAIGRSLPARPARSRVPFEGPAYHWTQVNELPAWPKPATTDADGRFTLRGVGRDMRVTLTVNDPRFALQGIAVETDRTPGSKQVTMALAPAQIITGRVTYADTGRPVARGRIEVGAIRKNGTNFMGFATDGTGQFRVNPSPGDRYRISASPPDGQPYLTAGTTYFEWPKGAVEHSVNLALPRGVMVRGSVTEEGSGKPVADAQVWFFGRRSTDDLSNPRVSKSRSGPDGLFQIAVQPSPGYLVIQGPSDDYVLREIGNRTIDQGLPGGRRGYSHAFIACDPKPGSHGLEIHGVLRRGATVHGRVLAPDGQPAQVTRMFSRVILEPWVTPWRHWFNASGLVMVRDGRFQVHGLDPDTEVPIYFLELRQRLGAAVQLSGKSAAVGPATVRLQPCGTAKARLVNPGGKPIAGYRGSARISIVVTPGAIISRLQDRDDGLEADVAALTAIDPLNYGDGPVTDAQGRIAFPALIPGAPYRITGLSKEFTVKAGETLDLGDILIEKPPG